MTYSYDFEFSGPVTTELGASLARHFDGAKLTSTASTNFTAQKITVGGSNAIAGGDYNAEIGRAKVAALGAFASHLTVGCVKVSGWGGAPVLAKLEGESIVFYL